MSQDVQIAAEKREATGKKAAKQLRGSGKVPAVVQQGGEETVHILIDGRDLLKAYHQAGKSQPIDLTIEGSKKLTLIKEIEFVPLRPEIQHVVFQAIKQNEAVEAEVPVHIEGEIPGEKQGLAVLRTMETVMIKALPRDLPETLSIPGEKLVENGDRLTIADIALPEGVELILPAEEEEREEFLTQPLAIIEIPTDAEEETASEGGEEGEAEVPSEHGEDTGEEAQEGEDQPGGKAENQDKAE